MIKIIIVDDHVLIREGLKKIIDGEWGMEVVAECTTSSSLLDIINKVEYDIIILDINLPDKSGLELLKDLIIRFPRIKVLILSIHPEERYAIRALKTGASGYLTKQSAAEELVKSIKRISQGGRYVSESLADKLAFNLTSPKSEKPHELLSDREFQVLLLIGSGKTIKETGEELSVSLSTINTYRKRIFEKMKLETNQELIRYTIINNLID
jgi:DNA-binding NarL/FixJ family response regulator